GGDDEPDRAQGDGGAVAGGGRAGGAGRGAGPAVGVRRLGRHLRHRRRRRLRRHRLGPRVPRQFGGRPGLQTPGGVPGPGRRLCRLRRGRRRSGVRGARGPGRVAGQRPPRLPRPGGGPPPAGANGASGPDRGV
ncbi:MAG: hypothetical protein AVDCRST_MAG73-3627, partial [uncultured Thermomicrobiales bacterium]